jgi:hypothetical protein
MYTKNISKQIRRLCYISSGKWTQKKIQWEMIEKLVLYIYSKNELYSIANRILQFFVIFFSII